MGWFSGAWSQWSPPPDQLLEGWPPLNASQCTLRGICSCHSAASPGAVQHWSHHPLHCGQLSRLSSINSIFKMVGLGLTISEDIVCSLCTIRNDISKMIQHLFLGKNGHFHTNLVAHKLQTGRPRFGVPLLPVCTGPTDSHRRYKQFVTLRIHHFSIQRCHSLLLFHLISTYPNK